MHRHDVVAAVQPLHLHALAGGGRGRQVVGLQRRQQPPNGVELLAAAVDAPYLLTEQPAQGLLGGTRHDDLALELDHAEPDEPGDLLAQLTGGQPAEGGELGQRAAGVAQDQAVQPLLVIAESQHAKRRLLRRLCR